MTEQEFNQRKDELNRQLKELRDQYINSNVTVPPGTMVTVNGKRVWLHGYKLVGGHITPIFYKLRPDGSASKQRAYLSYNAEIKKAE